MRPAHVHCVAVIGIAESHRERWVCRLVPDLAVAQRAARTGSDMTGVKFGLAPVVTVESQRAPARGK
jgi:hypothetical protein